MIQEWDGLSVHHSYVTAVAWDKEKGDTEGSEHHQDHFARHTSAGEIYKYALVSPHNAISGGDENKSSGSTHHHLDESSMGVGEFLMDIRRPDEVWFRKGRMLVHISSSQEDRDVWKFTLKKCLEMPTSTEGSRSHPSSPAEKAAARKMMTPSLDLTSRYLGGATHVLTEEEKAQEALFEQAKTLCTNASQKAVVTAVRAEYHLMQGRGELAAKYLAQCPSALEPFSDTSIRLALSKLGIDD